MIEETRAYKEEEEKRKIFEAHKKKDEEEERKKEAERKKAREEKRKLGLAVEDSPSRNQSMENIREAAGINDRFQIYVIVITHLIKQFRKNDSPKIFY